MVDRKIRLDDVGFASKSSREALTCSEKVLFPLKLEPALRFRDRDNDVGQLCVCYPRERWTEKRAWASLEITPPLGPLFSYYREGVAWAPCHTETEWIWCQVGSVI